MKKNQFVNIFNERISVGKKHAGIRRLLREDDSKQKSFLALLNHIHFSLHRTISQMLENPETSFPVISLNLLEAWKTDLNKSETARQRIMSEFTNELDINSRDFRNSHSKSLKAWMRASENFVKSASVHSVQKAITAYLQNEILFYRDLSILPVSESSSAASKRVKMIAESRLLLLEKQSFNLLYDISKDKQTQKLIADWQKIILSHREILYNDFLN